jgi:DNA invertase Pin-like site-specific DNA recombinase
MIPQPDLPWATYIRTSTFEQGEKSSPLKQLMANMAWAKNNGKVIPGIESAISGHKVVRGEYVFVDHQTGTRNDRPDLQRFLALARTGKIGGIVCYVVDRAARNMSDAVKIYRDLKRMHIGFKFAVQNFDDTPAGVLMFQIFCAFAEYEVEIIRERTHDGMRKRILGIGGNKDGKPRLQGPPLFGYRFKDGLPVVDEKEGPVAVFMLRRALASTDNTSHQIAHALNEAGHRTRMGKLWRPTGVAKLLRRADSYAAGTYRHRHGIEAAVRAHKEAIELMGSEAPPLDCSMIETIETAPYPPLIAHEEASLILARVAKNREERRGRPSRHYVLVSYIWCEVCGCRWYAKRGFYCCGCVQLGKPRCKARGYVAQERLEHAVLDGMRSYLKQPEVHYALAWQDYNANRGSSAQSRDQIEKQVKELSKQQVHYDEQATEYDLSPRQRDIARKKSKQLELKLAEVNAELRQLSVISLPSRSGIAMAFTQTLDLLDQMKTFQEKRRFVELTVQRILTDGHQVKVTGALDVRAIENKGLKGVIYSNRNLNSIFGDQNIRGLQVPVRNALPVRRIESVKDLRCVFDSLADG